MPTSEVVLNIAMSLFAVAALAIGLLAGLRLTRGAQGGEGRAGWRGPSSAIRVSVAAIT